MKRNHGKTGVSLLELMVATALLAVALVSIISVLISAMRLDNQTNEMSIAKQAAEFKLEHMRGYNGVNFPTMQTMVDLGGTTRHMASQPTSGNAAFLGFVENFQIQGLKPQTGDQDGMCGFCLVSRFVEGSTLTRLDPTGADNLFRIHVRIDWVSNVGGNQSYELFGLISDRGANWTGN